MSFKPTKEYLYTPRDCKYCGQRMSKELLLQRGARRGKNVSLALAQARENGERVGRPRSANFSKIIEARKSGLSIRKIADKFGCSTHTVQRALKYMDKAPSAETLGGEE